MMIPDHYAIDGLLPRAVERPLSMSAVSDALASAQADGLAVAPIGGGGALSLGNPIERYDLALDLTGLDRILEHQPSDLVLSVEAGVRMGELSEVLARHGQWLPIEAPHPEQATIGGLVATALSGPGRAAHGSLRDSLIGIAVAGPGGAMAKAGGMVVKNVSGFDLMRLHHGALGTLGVIVSANFKVLPKHRSEATVLVAVEDLAGAFEVVERARGLDDVPSAIVIAREAAEPLEVALRYDGRNAQVSTASGCAAEALGEDPRTLSEDESRAWWRASIDQLGSLSDDPNDLTEMRFGSTPSTIAATSMTLVNVVDSHDISSARLYIWPAVGSIVVRWVGTGDAAFVDGMAKAADHVGATWRIARAPAAIKRGRDIWGRPPAALDTIRRLKEEFDPSRTLNPGRFCGHL